ncbi:MAG: ATP-binding cassette domain-containing protein [Planctomycetota bacterium]
MRGQTFHQVVLETDPLEVVRHSADLHLRLPPMRLEAGAALAWLGPSGVGKTTALAALLGVAAPPAVTIAGGRRFAGGPLPDAGTAASRQWLRADVAFVPQDARAAFDPVVRLGVQLVEASGVGADACVAALRALDEPDAHDVLARYPHEVSGGQAQRALLALALARPARLLVLDEPTASLDEARRDLLAAALRARMAAGAAVLLATHDLEFARALSAELWTYSSAGVERGAPACVRWPARPEVPSPEQVVLRARGLEAQRGRRPVLRGVDLDLHAGELVAVLGPSGAGKTTLAAVLVGLLAPSAGRLERCGGSNRRAAGQLLFQDAYASLTPGRTLASLVRETAASRGAALDLARGLALTPADLERTASALSGGQRRRAALLRALTVAPRLLILDEPTASLDASTAATVLATVLDQASVRAAACLLITHDRGLAAAVAHRVLVLEHGVLRPLETPDST